MSDTFIIEDHTEETFPSEATPTEAPVNTPVEEPVANPVAIPGPALPVEEVEATD